MVSFLFRVSEYMHQVLISTLRANFDWALFAMPYSDEWHLQRKLMIQCIGAHMVERYDPMMQGSALEFAKNLLQTPEQFMANLKL